MFRKALLSAAAAAALACVGVTAQAQVLVEIEGPMSAYTPRVNNGVQNDNAGTLTVMNNTIRVTGTTAFVSPTETRADLFRRRVLDAAGNVVRDMDGNVVFETNLLLKRYNVTNWMLGDTFLGRTAAGLIGATVIVTGTVDPVSGLITAEEVFSDIAENVILGAVFENYCTTPRCDGEGNYIRGNGSTGPVFIPNKDKRLPALPITDAGLFELNLQDKTLNKGPANEDLVTTFGGEGYFTEMPVIDTDAAGPKGEERAVVYWAFELGENRPDLLLKPTRPEISTLRVRCTEGDRLEVRGFVHAPTNADGTAFGGNLLAQNGADTGLLNPTTGGQGRIRVVMDGVPYLDEDGALPVADLPATYGVYRLRAPVTQCADTVNVFWDRGLNITQQPWARALNVPVDRLREE